MASSRKSTYLSTSVKRSLYPVRLKSEWSKTRSQLLPLVGAEVTDEVLHRAHRSPVPAVVVADTLQVDLKCCQRRSSPPLVYDAR